MRLRSIARAGGLTRDRATGVPTPAARRIAMNAGSRIVLALASPWERSRESTPFLGPLDGAGVGALSRRRVVRTAGRDVVEDHWRGEPATIARILGLAGAPASAQ